MVGTQANTAGTSLPGSRRLAMGLLWATVAWNTVEGIVALAAGVAAGSVALTGFALDSWIEVTAAGILLWRLRLPSDDKRVRRRERDARWIIGATFMVLAVFILAEAAYVVATGDEPEGSSVGLVLALASLLVMPALGLAKRWNARPLNSPALIAESSETLACSYLSVTLFLGLGANAAFGWWWADVVAAFAMIPWIVKEGIEGLREEGEE